MLNFMLGFSIAIILAIVLFKSNQKKSDEILQLERDLCSENIKREQYITLSSWKKHRKTICNLFSKKDLNTLYNTFSNKYDNFDEFKKDILSLKNFYRIDVDEHIGEKIIIKTVDGKIQLDDGTLVEPIHVSFQGAKESRVIENLIEKKSKHLDEVLSTYPIVDATTKESLLTDIIKLSMKNIPPMQYLSSSKYVDEFDYQLITNATISKSVLELLEQGKHRAEGILSPYDRGLTILYKDCIKWQLDNDLIEKEDFVNFIEASKEIVKKRAVKE